MGGFDKDGVGTSVITGNVDCLVEETVKVFHANSFMVAASSDMEVDVQNTTDVLEQAFESAAIVDDDQATESNFEENILDEETGEVVSGGVVSGSNKDESCEITHGIHKVGLATVICNFSWGPKIDVENVEGAAEGPRKD